MWTTKQATGLLRLYVVEHFKNVFECGLSLGSEATCTIFTFFQINRDLQTGDGEVLSMIYNLGAPEGDKILLSVIAL